MGSYGSRCSGGRVTQSVTSNFWDVVAALPRRCDLHCYAGQFVGLATTVSDFVKVLSGNCDDFLSSEKLAHKKWLCV